MLLTAVQEADDAFPSSAGDILQANRHTGKLGRDSFTVVETEWKCLHISVLSCNGFPGVWALSEHHFCHWCQAWQ